MRCCGPTGAHPDAPGGADTPSGTSKRLKSGLLSTSCLWMGVTGLAVFALAGPALGVPASIAAAGLVLLCPLSMFAMMAFHKGRGAH